MLLVAKNINKDFTLSEGFFSSGSRQVCALENINFYVKKGETVGIVGESGSGKTTLARILAGIIPASRGDIVFSSDVTDRTRDVQLIFQDPFSALDPLKKIQDSLREPLRIHRIANADHVIHECFERVGLPPSVATLYPHQFSGGQRQRIVIARAIAPKPKLLICDEPTSSLDVSVQAQVMNLLMDLKQDLGMSMVFISHHLKLVRIISDRILVLYSGIIIEEGPCEDLMRSPQHPYTKMLVGFLGVLPGDRGHQSRTSPVERSRGCPYRTQCPVAIDRCKTEFPEKRMVGKNHFVACFNVC